MKTCILQIFVYSLLLLLSSSALAAGGIGDVAQNLLEPVTLFSDLVQTACLGIGGAFLFGALIKYFEHKRSPLMTPISTVVFLVIAGLVLVLIPILSFYMDNGVQYSLMK